MSARNRVSTLTTLPSATYKRLRATNAVSFDNEQPITQGYYMFSDTRYLCRFVFIL